MKHSFPITLFLIAFSAAATAQTKRIAILETIDKENKVPYAVEVMVRSNLTKVISNTEGYDGYDRVNISQIMDEHEFERTGLVNEDQIRQLGAISGADYLLVSEVVIFYESNIFVTAKILNVESAKTEGSENALMGMTPKDIQHGCESLANRLLGLPDPIVQSPANSDLNAPSVQQIEQQLEEKGKNIMVFGWIMLGVGGCVTAAFPGRSSTSATYYGNILVSSESHYEYTGQIIGGAVIACSIPLIISGTIKKKQCLQNL